MLILEDWMKRRMRLNFAERDTSVYAPPACEMCDEPQSVIITYTYKCETLAHKKSWTSVSYIIHLCKAFFDFVS